MPTILEDYLFDLRGFLVLRVAVGARDVARLNATIDAIPPLKAQAWHGNVHRHDYADGWRVIPYIIIETGPPFDYKIDNPGWIEHVRRYVGNDDGLFIDEALVTHRGPGQGVNMHSGGHKRRIRTQFRFH